MKYTQRPSNLEYALFNSMINIDYFSFERVGFILLLFNVNTPFTMYNLNLFYRPIYAKFVFNDLDLVLTPRDVWQVAHFNSLFIA